MPTTPTTPTTLLDAINALLRAARIGRVQSLLLAETNKDAAEAKLVLDDVTREFLSRGWFFNSEDGVVLDPDEDGYVDLPANCLTAKSYRYRDGGTNRLTVRGNRLYDPTRHTSVMTGAVEIDYVLALPFEDLSQTARTYVTALAARRFAIPKLPAGATFQYTEDMVRGAMVAFEDEDNRQRGQNLTETSPHFGKFSRR